jgi:hypothetical protein
MAKPSLEKGVHTREYLLFDPSNIVKLPAAQIAISVIIEIQPDKARSDPIEAFGEQNGV